MFLVVFIAKFVGGCFGIAYGSLEIRQQKPDQKSLIERRRPLPLPVKQQSKPIPVD